MFVLIRSSLYPCGSRPLQMFASAFTLMCVLFLESSMHCFFPSFSLGWFSLVKVFPLKNNYFPYTSVTSPLSVAHPNSLCYNFLPLSLLNRSWVIKSYTKLVIPLFACCLRLSLSSLSVSHQLDWNGSPPFKGKKGGRMGVLRFDPDFEWRELDIGSACSVISCSISI